MKKELNFADYYRVIGMGCILLCHFTQESRNPYLNMLAQFFNIGVPMFIILSGFLFGIRGGQSADTIQWLEKRFVRVYIPYGLFVFLLLVIHLICGKNVLRLDWLWLIMGMQGTVVGVQGAEQTWFITTILLCYLVTPILDKCCNWDSQRKNVLKVALIIIPSVLALIAPIYVSTMCSPICWYGLAYILGNEFDHVQFDKKWAVVAFIIMCSAFGIRLVARMIIDGTILYNRIVTGYTHAIAAFAIFYLVAFLTKDWRLGRVTAWLSSISFEVYLYHYMFCVGPVRLFSLTESWLINCGLVIIITVAIASFMKMVSNVITKRIHK